MAATILVVAVLALADLRCTDRFRHARHAFPHPGEGGVAQARHAFASRLPRDGVRSRSGNNEFAHCIGDGHELMHAHSSPIPNAMTRSTATRFERTETGRKFQR